MAFIDPALRDSLLTGRVPDYGEAVSIQMELGKAVSQKAELGKVRTVAGADLAVLKKEKKLVSGIIVFSYPGLEVLERAHSVSEEKFPYVPGLLSFREAPAVIEAYGKLKTRPDVLIMDGHGIAHPRGVGIASHLGVLLDVPSIGVAKKKLYGAYEEPGAEPGDWSPLVSNNGKMLGAVLRTRASVKPVFVSVGHKIDLKTSLEIINTCRRGYRIPEPTRQADKYVAELKRGIS